MRAWPILKVRWGKSFKPAPLTPKGENFLTPTYTVFKERIPPLGVRGQYVQSLVPTILSLTFS